MWLQTYGKKLVNMNSVSVVDITPSPLNERTFHVEAWWAGEENSSVILHVGTYVECELYRAILSEDLNAKKIEVMS